MWCRFCAYNEDCKAKTLEECRLFKEQQQVEKERQKYYHEIQVQLDRIAKSIKSMEKR